MDTKMTGLPLDPAVLLGWQTKPDAPISPLWDAGEDHIVTVGPTGSGKGVSCLIPALLTWHGPAIIIDPKGEAYNVTARYRADIGQRVHLLDPFGVTRTPTDALNPLDLIDTNNPSAVEDAAMLANVLTEGVRSAREPFWDDRANALITGLILNVLTDDDYEKSLTEVRACINLGQLFHRGMAEELAQHHNPEIATIASTLNMPSNTYHGIIATAAAHTSFLRNGPVHHATINSTVSLSDITKGAPMTLYIVLPPEKLHSHGRLLRLWISVILTSLMRRREMPPVPTLLLIDEAAQLGYLDQMLTAVTLLRGYGVKLWTFWQCLSQLKALYPFHWQTFLNNCRTQQFLTPASPYAAAHLEDYLAQSNPRPLLQLKQNEALLCRSGQTQPHVVRRPDYRADHLFQGRFDPNPFFKHRANALPRSSTLPTNVYRFEPRRSFCSPQRGS